MVVQAPVSIRWHGISNLICIRVCDEQEQQAEAARIMSERKRLQQEQAAAARAQAEQKKRMKEEQLRQKQMLQVCHLLLSLPVVSLDTFRSVIAATSC